MAVTTKWLDRTDEAMSVSRELKDWAALAGYSLTVGSEGGLTDIFWNKGGEIRLFLRESINGWVNVTCSDRMQPEYFFFGGRSIDVVERFFFLWFGHTIRNNRGMPSLNTPNSPAKLADGYHVAPRQIDSVDRYALIDSCGTIIAITSGGKFSAQKDLVPLSTRLHTQPSKIRHSFIEDSGQRNRKTGESRLV